MHTLQLMVGAISAVAQEPDRAQRSLQEFVMMRALMIEAPNHATISFLPNARQPKAAGAPVAASGAVWQEFFRGSLLTVGRVSSSHPLAMHYNAYVDVAVLQGCSPSSTGGPACQTFCAVPGEALMGSRSRAATPAWLRSPSFLTALTDTTRARVAAFRSAHPAGATDATDWARRYCRAEWQDAAAYRVMRAGLSTRALDQLQLGRAIGSFLKAGGNDATRPPGSDSTIRHLLGRLDQFNLAGAVALPRGGQVVFFAPKRSGWVSLALLFGPIAVGRKTESRLLDAVIINFSDKGP